MSFQAVTHVIFDMDGLLIDSETIYNRIISNISKEYGKEYTLETRQKILGTQHTDTARLAVELMELPISTEEWLKKYKAACAIELVKPDLLPGAEKLLRHLHKHNVLFGMATSSSDQVTAIKTQHYKPLFSLFHHKVMGTSDEEVKRGKPEPDIFLVCASRFPDKPDPAKCLVFEDAPNGVRGALAAGMQVVMVPMPELSPELKKDATLVLNSLTEFKPELFGLPSYD